MQPVRMSVIRIIDFGTIVSIVGTDLQSGKPIAIHIDHRPFQSFWDAWQAAGFTQPIEFDANRLTLSLEIGREDEDAVMVEDDENTSLDLHLQSLKMPP